MWRGNISRRMRWWWSWCSRRKRDGRHSRMNTQAFLILLIPALGLFSIFRGGRFNWDPIGRGGPAWLNTPFLHRLLGVMAWLGWIICLIVGTLLLFRLWPGR